MPQNSPRDQVYKFGDFVFVADDPMLMRDGKRIPVTPRVLNVLRVLVENPGRIVTKENLMSSVWSDSFVEEGNLNRTVSRLRKILGETATENRFIETVPRVGYRFIADVEKVERIDRASDIIVRTPEVIAPTTRRERSLSLLIPVAAIMLIAIAAIGIFLLWPKASPPTESRTSAVTKPPKGTPVRLTSNPTREERPEFTNDGDIRFIRWQGDVAFSFVMNADGTNVRRDTSIANLRTGSWSPDGKKVIFYKENDESNSLYFADSDGSNESKLPFLAGNADWSPDGSQLLYQFGKSNSDIYLYTFATQKNTELITGPGFESDPSFSPDGKTVAFVSDRDGNPEIYLQNIDGSGLRRLTNHPAHDEFPTFSPDGTQIAFNSNRDDENFGIYVMNTDGSGVKRLTNWQTQEEIRPGCWSADGSQIVFVSDKDGKSNIFTMETEPFSPAQLLADGQRNLTTPAYAPSGSELLYVAESDDKLAEMHIRELQTGSDRVLLQSDSADMFPKFSPDGSWILFQNRVGGNAEICRIRVSGGDVVNLTNNATRDARPAWSPDGAKIVFSSNREGNYDVYALYTMNADGSDQHRIYYSNAISTDPSWSPDGRQIVFSNDKEDGRTGNFEIFSIEPETTNPERRLTFRRRYDTQPVFSPDGRRIVFTSNTDGNAEIYLMNADGSGLLRLTRDAGDDTGPSWSPDGRKIIFSSNRSGRYAIYEVAVD